MGYSTKPNRDALEDLMTGLKAVDNAWESFCHGDFCQEEHECVSPPADLEPVLGELRAKFGEAIIIQTAALHTELVSVKDSQ